MAREESPKQSLIEKIVPILLVLSIGLAFVVGVLWNKVSSLEKGGTANGGSPAVAGAAATPAPVSIDQAGGTGHCRAVHALAAALAARHAQLATGGGERTSGARAPASGL